MSKSLDFCIDRALNPNVSSFSDRPWHDAIEYDSERYFDQHLHGIRKWMVSGKTPDGYAIAYNIELQIKPGAEFSYFTSSASVHDGTMLFILENIENCIWKVMKGETHDSRIAIKPWCTLAYTVGNIVLLNEYDAHGNLFAPKEKPWMTQRTTCLLPISMTAIYNENGELNESNS